MNTQTPVLDELLVNTPFMADEESLNIASCGINALVGELQTLECPPTKIDRPLIDHLIASIDQRIGHQIDEVLHHTDFQKLESAWRGLKYTVDHADFRENIKIDVLNVTKEDLTEDFADSPEIPKSGLYKLVYTSEYAQFGGEPYGAMISNFEFTHKNHDISLLQKLAAVATMAHAPFIAAASPIFFGINDITQLPGLKDISAIFEGPLYTKWKSFRESEDARYVGLTLPRFLLREPYSTENNPIRGFDYDETIQEHENYLWGNTSAALATRICDSFAKYRWCPNIIGPQSGGAVEDLPLHHFSSMGDLETKIPTEVLVSDRREYELAEAGFISLSFRKGSDNAAFFSANSTQKPKFFGISEAGKTSELNYKLGTQLPYLFIVCRIAHYLKVLQREQLGSWKEAEDLEKELNLWISQYIADQDNAPAEVRSRRPLRNAKIDVHSIEGEPGWYGVKINIRPHFKYMGSDITLSLTGRIENDG